MSLWRVWSVCLLGCFSGLTANAHDRLQHYLNAQMRGQRGAVIVSNPATGEILAEWNPEMAFHQMFPPGSTAKLVTSAMALENDLISSTDRVFCRRVPELLGEPYHCSHPPAMEPFTLASALANSCNYFFGALSGRLDAATLSHGYSMFGFGDASDPRSGYEGVGRFHISDEPAAKARAALGERPILVTPAQLLLAYSAVAMRGTVYRLRRRGDSRKRPEVLRRINLKAATWTTLAQGFAECVRRASGQGAAVPGVRVAGKTGTASASAGGATHAWFVGYAPEGTPEIALVVLLERGTGARDAAPLAGRILRHYFASQGPK